MKIVVVAFAFCVAGWPAFGEPKEGPHGAGPAPVDSTRPAGESTLSFDAAKKSLKESAPGSAAYWTAAHAILNGAGTDSKKIDDIENELSDRRKSLFQELRKARGNADNDALRKAAQSAPGDAREAARAELDRRVSDPNVAFVAKEALIRPELALKFMTKYLAALESKDPKKIADVVARLLGTLGQSQVETLNKHTGEALQQADKLKEKGINETLIKNLFEATSARLGKSVAKSDFTEALKPALEAVDKRNERFHEMVARVIKGGDDGKRAKAILEAEYDKDVVADFIGARSATGDDGIAVNTARAFAREQDGKLFLDLEASNFAFGDKDRNQSLLLGDKDNLEQIRASLAAFQTGEQRGHDGELAPDFNGAKTDRFQRFRLASTPGEGTVRLFAGEGDGGKPTLRRSETPVPKEKLATQRITAPHTLPNPPPLPPEEKPTTPTPTATPTGGGGGGGGGGSPADKVAAVIASKTCQKCHAPDAGVGALPLKIEGGRLRNQTLKGALEKATNNDSMELKIRNQIRDLAATL